MSRPPGEGWHRIFRKPPLISRVVTDSDRKREVRHYGTCHGGDQGGKGLWIAQRTEALIGVADPLFRDEMARQALAEAFQADTPHPRGGEASDQDSLAAACYHGAMETAGERAQLGDGTDVLLRPIRADDASKLIALHSRLSPESVYLRFLGPRPTLPPEEARRLATVDYDRTMAIVATQPRGDEEAIVGVARYAAVRPDSNEEAEAAIVVEDAFQGMGLGTVLMRRLIEHARGRGVATMSAEIKAGNERMLRFIRRSGLPFSQRLEGGSWQIRADIAYNGP